VPIVLVHFPLRPGKLSLQEDIRATLELPCPEHPYLHTNEVTLPVLLKRVGYQTAAFGKTHYYFPRKYEYDTCVDLSEYHEWLNQKGRQLIPPEIDVQ